MPGMLSATAMTSVSSASPMVSPESSSICRGPNGFASPACMTICAHAANALNEFGGFGQHSGQPASSHAVQSDQRQVRRDARQAGSARRSSVMAGFANWRSAALPAQNRSIVRERRAMSGVVLRLFPVTKNCMRLATVNDWFVPRMRSRMAVAVTKRLMVLLARVLMSSR